MDIRHINYELFDILVSFIREAQVRQGIKVIDVVGLAEAWICGKDEAWADRNRLPKELLPDNQIQECGYPFSSGIFLSRPEDSLAHISPGLPFVSPSMERAQGGAAIPMLSFGPLGAQRYTNLHEAGHYIENEMNLHTGQDSLNNNHRSECRADGFAIAWAVANGADPKACVRDVGVFRACSEVNRIHAAYLTYPILEAAAQIGLESRNAPRSLRIMEQIAHMVVKQKLGEGILHAADGKSLTELKTVNEPILDEYIRNGIIRPMNNFLAQQPTWSTAQEDEWWKTLTAANPDCAKTLNRTNAAIFLSQISTRSALKMLEGEPAISPHLVFSRMKRAALAEGSDRWIKLQALVPQKESAAANAQAFIRAARLFNNEEESRIAACLELIGQGTQKSTEPMSCEMKFNISGIEDITKPFLLVDLRQPLSQQVHYRIIERVREGGVHAISVLADTEQKARDYANFYRRSGDCLRASAHPLTPKTFTEKKLGLQKSLADNRLWIIGELPELRRSYSYDRAR